MDGINAKGIIIGLIVFFMLLGLSADSIPCLQSNTCSGGDLFAVCVTVLGLAVPGVIAAVIGSSLFNNK